MYSIVVRKLCGCTKDRKEAHDYEIEGFKGFVEITILSDRL
jgi:hypothetical protein